MDSSISLLLFILTLILVIVLIVGLVSLYWFGFMLISLFAGGGPYVPSRMERVDIMIQLAKLTATDRVMDMGSGDGRILLAALEAGAKEAIGYEVHYELVRRARSEAKRRGFSDRARVFWKSMWKADLADVNVVFLYQIPYAMRKIGDKLQRELPPGARIVSNGFSIPEWQPAETNGHIYLYIKP